MNSGIGLSGFFHGAMIRLSSYSRDTYSLRNSSSLTSLLIAQIAISWRRRACLSPKSSNWLRHFHTADSALSHWLSASKNSIRFGTRWLTMPRFQTWMPASTTTCGHRHLTSLFPRKALATERDIFGTHSFNRSPLFPGWLTPDCTSKTQLSMTETVTSNHAMQLTG